MSPKNSPITTSVNNDSVVPNLTSNSALEMPINANRDTSEGLLTPMSRSSTPTLSLLSASNKSIRPDRRAERNLWHSDEVLAMLDIMRSIDAIERLNDKSLKSELVFKDVEEIMFKKGFRKKTHLQIWTKWKFLKSTYNTSKRNGVKPRMIAPHIYMELHKMLHNNNQGTENNTNPNCTVVSTKLTNSGKQDENSSSNSVFDDQSYISSSGLVINSIENNSNSIISNNNKSTITNVQDYGIAHPIFGFRLGIVKAEPIDADYEVIENNDLITNKDVKFNNRYDPIKLELENKDNRREKDLDERISKKNLEEEEVLLNEKKNENNTEANDKIKILSSLNNSQTDFYKKIQISDCSIEDINQTQTKPTLSLRAAPFAKISNINKNIITTTSQPPPLLKMQLIAQPKHVTNYKMLNSKLLNENNLSKSISESTSRILPEENTSNRISREVTFNNRINNNNNNNSVNNFPKMKQVPMRKTPYSLRPDRAIPDLESSTSTEHSESSVTSKYIEIPTTNQLILQSSQDTLPNKRKRRVDFPSRKSTLINPNYHFRSNNLHIDNKEEAPKIISPQIQSDHLNESQPQQNSQFTEYLINKMTTSLLAIQHDFMQDFFRGQKELMLETHKLQSEQNLLLMKTWQQQTLMIMKTMTKAMKTQRTSVSSNTQNARHTKCQYCQQSAQPTITKNWKQKIINKRLKTNQTVTANVNNIIKNNYKNNNIKKSNKQLTIHSIGIGQYNDNNYDNDNFNVNNQSTDTSHSSHNSQNNNEDNEEEEKIAKHHTKNYRTCE